MSMFLGAPGTSEAGGYLCPLLCASDPLTSCCPGPLARLTPQDRRHGRLPSRMAPAGGASAPPRSADAIAPLLWVEGAQRPRDQAVRRVCDSGSLKTPTVVQRGKLRHRKRGGKLLRSPEHQSQVPAHHTPLQIQCEEQRGYLGNKVGGPSSNWAAQACSKARG